MNRFHRGEEDLGKFPTWLEKLVRKLAEELKDRLEDELEDRLKANFTGLQKKNPNADIAAISASVWAEIAKAILKIILSMVLPVLIDGAINLLKRWWEDEIIASNTYELEQTGPEKSGNSPLTQAYYAGADGKYGVWTIWKYQ